MRKTSTIKSLCLAVAFVFAGFAANAQLTHLEQSFFLNFNAPSPGFGGDLSSEPFDGVPMTRFRAGSSAGLGIGFGYRFTYRFDVGFGEISPYIQADANLNWVKGDIRDDFMTKANDGTAPKYINVPIFVGVNYRYQLNEIFTPFAEFGLGPDFFFITKEKGTVNTAIPQLDGTTETIGDFNLKYQSSSKFAFQLGLGCFFGEHVSASLHYSGYGKRAIKYTSKTEIPEALKEIEEATPGVQSKKVGLFSLRIGFHF